MHAVRRFPIASLVLAAAATRASAQTGVAWVEFAEQPDTLGPGVAAVSDVSTDVDFATGDLDQDGWLDVVVARKPQGSQLAKHADVLLMNLEGVLTDQTALYASASDVAGDQGFLTPCVHTAVKLADVDMDGWLDVIFSASLSDGEPKVISHPRVYVNQGDDVAGAWQGLATRTGASLSSSPWSGWPSRRALRSSTRATSPATARPISTSSTTTAPRPASASR